METLERLRATALDGPHQWGNRSIEEKKLYSMTKQAHTEPWHQQGLSAFDHCHCFTRVAQTRYFKVFACSGESVPPIDFNLYIQIYSCRSKYCCRDTVVYNEKYFKG